MINDIEKEILQILYEYRTDRTLEASKVYKEVSGDLSRAEVIHHLENLKEKKYVRTKSVKPIQTGPYKVSSYNTYEINSRGVELVENNFELEPQDNHVSGMVIYGNNIHLGNVYNTNVSIGEVILEVTKDAEEREEIEKVIQEIDEAVENEMISKCNLRRLFNKIAEKGFDKLTDAAFAYIGSKLMGL